MKNNQSISIGSARVKLIDLNVVICFHSFMRKAIKTPRSRHFHYGVWGLFFLNVLLFGDVFWGEGHRMLSSSQADLFLHFAAWRQFAFDELRQGHLVLWNPHYLCGA